MKNSNTKLDALPFRKLQKKGLCEALISYCEKYCINRNANLIWLNARKVAVSFYEKMAYQKKGMPFEI